MPRTVCSNCSTSSYPYILTNHYIYKSGPAIYPVSYYAAHTVFHHPYYCTTVWSGHHLSKSALYLPPHPLSVYHTGVPSTRAFSVLTKIKSHQLTESLVSLMRFWFLSSSATFSEVVLNPQKVSYSKSKQQLSGWIKNQPRVCCWQ